MIVVPLIVIVGGVVAVIVLVTLALLYLTKASRKLIFLWILFGLVVLGFLLFGMLPIHGRVNQCNIESKIRISEIETALADYKKDNGILPTNEQGLKALMYKPTISPLPEKWNGSYLIPFNYVQDPWHRDFIYRNPGIHNPQSYDVYSLGYDGKDGTKDDIGNWNLDR